ncbi:hypothetical protein [Sphingobium subterraneum]|uniref:SCP2 domain-containing protein n=1 Tax=Sphingobium subterraneum TaxID=627688 RepID=A0A841IXB1_9SPHN|nr:hypothetical protein [Sphingobium subterraneum]MBB6122782.1 hypothetical protein [Sphingobium subterraneum]
MMMHASGNSPGSTAQRITEEEHVMTTANDVHAKIRQGTEEWFYMAGSVIVQAIEDAGVSPSENFSLVERYTDGTVMSNGLVQGIRIEIIDGRPSFRVGAQENESADVTVEVTAAAARKLNALHNSSPDYEAVRTAFLNTGEMRVTGDVAKIGSWLDAAHDPIVDRTT